MKWFHKRSFHSQVVSNVCIRNTFIQGSKHFLSHAVRFILSLVVMVKLYLACAHDPDQRLKRHHHHRNANQSSAAAMLTKSKQKIKTCAYIFGGDVTIYMYSPPLSSPMSLFVTKFGYSIPPLLRCCRFWMVS